jgi:hypothetical protein
MKLDSKLDAVALISPRFLAPLMRFSIQPLLCSTSLTLSLAGCALPAAGTWPAGGQQPVVAEAGPPTAGEPTAALSPRTPTPAETADARLRVQASVIVAGKPASDVNMTAIDLATGKALPLTPWSGAEAGAQNGAFDLALPALADDQLVKLVANTGTQTLTTIFDARGRAVGAADPFGGYSLRQGHTEPPTIRLQLTAASTGATECFEGVLKLTLLLPREVGGAVRAAALARAEQAGRELASALTRKPELAQALLASVAPSGEVRDIGAFRSAIARLGAFDALHAAVQGQLKAVTAHILTSRGELDPLSGEEFPLASVTISQPGGFSFTSDLTGSSHRGQAAISPAVPALTLAERFTLGRVAGNATGSAGSDTSATTTSLRAVSGVAVAPDGTLYLADPLRHQVLRSVAGGPLVRIAGTRGGIPGLLDNVAAVRGEMNGPAGLLWDAALGVLMVCDAGNGLVRVVLPGGTIGTLAGGGAVVTSPTTAMALKLDDPVALAPTSSGSYFVADRAGGRVWRLDGSGVATLVASIPGACALASDPARDLLWVGTTAGAVWRVKAASTNPSADQAQAVFAQAGHAVHGLASDQQGVLFVLAAKPSGDARLWRVPTDSQGQLELGQTATPIAGTGEAAADGSAYAAPTTPLADAKNANLSVLHPGSLAVDLSAADAVATPSGQLYVGSSFANGVTWGQTLRLDLTF